ncbi:mechanosensitive ion channel [Rhodocytophaga aerolata]|uniref:Mechanosensitive ion channel n=1 Tax=Rhodocytophaga aerolata TaxID=455078 RepID=A0ABT8REU4_9BACT|nr:mechanosensitive ion channel domain-containing protein [Rhodocytophaga aerolata]MDO1449859.1 mechanosensitive ion channel [Rhodocytophaga aerolata]
MKEFFDKLQLYFRESILRLGNTDISFGDVLYFVIYIFILFYVTGKLTALLDSRILSRYIAETGVRQSIGSIFKYTLLTIGIIVIVQSAGVDLSTLGILAGALGVGIGLGLQNITNNFISGIIILFERHIRIGDRIAVGEVTGDVVKISARATTVITNDNISILSILIAQKY